MIIQKLKTRYLNDKRTELVYPRILKMTWFEIIQIYHYERTSELPIR